MKYGFAGNRDISVNILLFLIEQGYRPSFLIISKKLDNSIHQNKLLSISNLSSEDLYYIEDINQIYQNNPLNNYMVDYIFGIHFPFIINSPVLEAPNIGFLNLHPAYLPFNKGWHTPTWAILDNSKYGATLHFMTEDLDAGDIVAQKEVMIKPYYTANQLYQLVLDAEENLFKEALPQLLTLNPSRLKQRSQGTSHVKNDLKKTQEIDLSKKLYPLELIDKLRALTTSSLEEAAYFEIDGNRYSIQINITPK